MKAIHSCSIHKFGGSSLADSSKIKAIKTLVKGKNEIIVVSAVQGVTSSLQILLDLAKKGLDYQQPLNQLEQKHFSLIEELGLAYLGSMIQNDLAKINDILYAIQITQSYSSEIQGIILGFGELWSAQILTHFLGQSNRVIFLDAAEVVFIYEREGMICVDWQRSKAALLSVLKDVCFDQLVIPGFIASTLNGQRTILGRNGSDFSAAIFANLFEAKSLTIWTDVDGIYSAHPNVVHSAFVIPSLSYKEAFELAYFGAKVLHPMTIAPVVEQQIPIYIKNSFNPHAPGTYISQKTNQSLHLIKGLSSIENVALINIEGSGLISVSGITSRVADLLNRAQVNVMLIVQASSEHSICFAVPALSIDKAMTVLRENLEAELERKLLLGIQADPDCAILSAIGDEMIGAVGISAKLCTALAKSNINIRAISQGSSERNISLVIKNRDLIKAMRAVHSGFYLSPKTLAIGLIGPGSVAKSFLHQLRQGLDKLRSTYQIDLHLLGIMNSKRMLLKNTTISLEHWQDDFSDNGVEANLSNFINHIAEENLSHAVIIDCTADESIAKQYLGFMDRDIHVITPNKHANAGDLGYYKQLKKRAYANQHYFYEATVCAGLPVISTLQDLIKTGDEIHQVEGVLSGTLSYIFNELAKGRTFSSVVIDAKNQGFTEPDPREDLSGMDVARKLICLAREIGHDVSLCDVKVLD
ncbi:MAG: bifunctional aspartate kinase/homoserine dehydrogenase I [Tatlockia sp.]|nr:bifunctional aspartate kinase/homoserine dehydrogenase I [Tatlockia sp.]